MIKKNELKDLSIQGLHTELASLRRELFHAKLGISSGQIRDTSVCKKLRVRIAQTLTFIRQKRADNVVSELGGV